MHNLTVERAAINAPLLDEELRAALGESCQGLSHYDDLVRVIFAEAPTAEQRDAARAAIAKHDPKKLSSSQQAEKDRDDSPFFVLSRDALAAHVTTMAEPAFRLAMVRSFADLRDMIRGA